MTATKGYLIQCRYNKFLVCQRGRLAHANTASKRKANLIFCSNELSSKLQQVLAIRDAGLMVRTLCIFCGKGNAIGVAEKFFIKISCHHRNEKYVLAAQFHFVFGFNFIFGRLKKCLVYQKQHISLGG